MREWAYVNGRFCDLADATVSIDDRGFQFADGVYEVLVAYRGRPFRMKEHLARLVRSCRLIDLALPPALDLPAIIHEGLERAGLVDTLVYLQVTRGVQPRSHVYRDDLTPTIVVTFRAKPVIDPAVRARGYRLMTVPDIRWSCCEVKATALLANVLVKNRALRRGFDDAVFVSAEGEVREATAANVFVVRQGVLWTPVSDESILHGVTRSYILECAARADVPLREGGITVADLESADEVFVSSTTLDILPATQVNERRIGAGRPGPVTERLYATFFQGLESNET